MCSIDARWWRYRHHPKSKSTSGGTRICPPILGHAQRVPAKSTIFRVSLSYQALQKAEILLISVGSEIERWRHLYEIFFFYLSFMLLHETSICPPGHACSLDGVAFSANRNLMGMQIVKPQFIKQRFLHYLVREQKRFYPHRLHQPTKLRWQVAIDKHRVSVDAVAGDMWNSKGLRAVIIKD